MSGTRFYTHGTGNAQRSTASRLIANTQFSQQSLDETVELYDERDIFESETLEGCYFIRSKFSPHRYYTFYDGECSCGTILCRHLKILLTHSDSDIQVCLLMVAS